ncbi:MAG: hypothetical protein ACREU8_09660, partial [Gammaproteobacteria bacterium]
GGNYQGKGPEPNAKQTFVAKGASVKADATGNGDGGEIIVWSDEVTRFRGDLSARGGQEGGDGGFIEVSGKQGLEFVGTASVEATKGLDGNILFDPQTIDIIEDGGGEDDQASDGEIRFPDVGVNGNVFFTITNDAIQNLNGNLLFQAQDSIFINAPLNFVNLGQGESISFQANGGIGVNFDVTTQGADLRFEADLDRVTSEGTTLDIGDPGDAETDPSSVQIGTNGGNIDLIAQNIGIVDGSVIDAGTGDIHLARIVDANPGLGSAPAAADITVGSEAFLSENDFDAFVTSGTLTLGRASFFGPDGILDAAPLTAPALTVDAPIQANATNLALISAGALNINADVTAASLTASGATIGLQDVTTTGDQSYTGALTFNSDYITNGGNFLVVGNTLLESDSSVSTGGGGITFNGSIDSAVVEGDPAGLELDAGGEGISGDIFFGGDVGVGPVTIDSAGDITIPARFVAGDTSFTYSGSATSPVDSLNLTSLFLSPSAQGATVFGTVGGASGEDAALAVQGPINDPDFTINNCVIGVACGQPVIPEPVIPEPVIPESLQTPAEPIPPKIQGGLFGSTPPRPEGQSLWAVFKRPPPSGDPREPQYSNFGNDEPDEGREPEEG